MGVSSDNGNSGDLQAAMAGGSTFEQRLAELAAAKQSLVDAYTDLGVGRNAKEAAVAAAKDKADAEKLLADAREQAAGVISKAQEDAAQTERRAKLRADELMAACIADVDAKKAEAEKLLAEAKAANAEVKDEIKSARQLRAEAKAATEKATEEMTRAKEAADAHEAEAKRLNELREKVLAALALI